MSLGILEWCKHVFKEPIIQGLPYTHIKTRAFTIWILWIYRIVSLNLFN